MKIEEKRPKNLNSKYAPKKFFFVKISFFPETLDIFHHLRSITYSKILLSKFYFLAKNLNRYRELDHIGFLAGGLGPPILVS